MLNRIIPRKNGAIKNISTSDFAIDVLMGLNESPKSIPSRYIYDERGSRLFSIIMDLPEYYPTRCEKAILNTYKDRITSYMNDNFNLVELGAGDGRKTIILLKHLLNRKLRFSYIPIDISKSAINGLVGNLNEELPGLKVNGLISEYFTGLKTINKMQEKQNLVLFLGSSIGNFMPDETLGFLVSLRDSLKKNDMVLMGFDLVKDPDILNRAYNDSQGITKSFNLNLLRRINRELDGDFNENDFDFYARYNPASKAVESYLLSGKQAKVNIRQIKSIFEFGKYEAINTEYSFKYDKPQIQALAGKSGFRIVDSFSDVNEYFMSSIWMAE